MTSILHCLLAALLLVWATASAAKDDPRVVISSGHEGGSYFRISERLKLALIRKKAALPVGMTSQGSMENLARLDDPENRVNVALVQADALRSYLGEHAEFQDEFFVLADMGQECALLITSRVGGLSSVADLKKEGAGSLSVDSAGSGAALTFAAMCSLDPAFGATRAVSESTLASLVQMKASREFTNLRGALIVQRPSKESPALKAVLDDRDAYRFVSITEKDLPNAELPDGSSIYTFRRVAVGSDLRKERPLVRTFCTRALLLGSRTKLDQSQRDLLSQILLESHDEISGEK